MQTFRLASTDQAAREHLVGQHGCRRKADGWYQHLHIQRKCDRGNRMQAVWLEVQQHGAKITLQNNYTVSGSIISGNGNAGGLIGLAENNPVIA